MKKALVDWFWRGGASYDADFATVISRWTALGYTHPSALVLTSLNQLVLDLKTYGIWTGLDALWVPMLNNDAIVSTTGAINFKNPSANQLTFPVAPTFTTSGFIGDNSTQYCLTNFNPSTHGVQLALNSASRIALLYSAGTLGSYIDGHVTSGNDLMILSGSSGLNRVNTSNNLSSSWNSSGVGYKAVDRIDSTNMACYNETTRSTFTSTSVAKINENLTILRSNFGFGNSGIAMYAVGRSFTQTEHGNIRTAMLAHKSRLGL